MSRQCELAIIGFAALCIIVYGCIHVPITIYWPEKDLEEAADQIVGEVRSEIVEPEGADGSPSAYDGIEVFENDGESEAARPIPDSWMKTASSLGQFLNARFDLTRAASAQDKSGVEDDSKKVDVKLNVSTPKIKKIKKIKATLKARQKKLLSWFQKNVLGEAYDGYIALHVQDGLSLKEKRAVNGLVKTENRDRKNLYTAIADENDIGKGRVKDIGVLFSKSWQKSCKPGWWIETKKGRWEKKKKKPRKKSA